MESSTLKLPLLRINKNRLHATAIRLKACLPFVDNKLAIFLHRPIEITSYSIHKRPHIAIHFWCGALSSGPHDKYTFLSSYDGDKFLCTRCEAAAIMAGLPSADELIGTHVHKGKLIAAQTCTHKMD